jgi:hypothetical protein
MSISAYHPIGNLKTVKAHTTVEGAGIMHYFHTDHLNSTTVVTDQTGHEVEEMGYLPFGALLYDKRGIRDVHNIIS